MRKVVLVRLGLRDISSGSNGGLIGGHCASIPGQCGSVGDKRDLQHQRQVSGRTIAAGVAPAFMKCMEESGSALAIISWC